MNFVFYNKCEKIKNVIKFRFCLKNTDKNTRELGINLKGQTEKVTFLKLEVNLGILSLITP